MATWTDLENATLSVRSQTQKAAYCMVHPREMCRETHGKQASGCSQLGAPKGFFLK